MGRAYGNDLRVRVVAAGARGASARSVAARFGIGVSTAIRWLRRSRETGDCSAFRQGKPGGSCLDGHEAFITDLLKAQKDMTLDEMVTTLQAERSVSIGRSMLSVWLRRRGWTFKKRPVTHWSRSDRMS